MTKRKTQQTGGRNNRFHLTRMGGHLHYANELS